MSENYSQATAEKWREAAREAISPKREQKPCEALTKQEVQILKALVKQILGEIDED